jgi:hypothetical protein
MGMAIAALLREEKGKETSDRDAERGCVKQTMQRQTIERRVSGERLLFLCLGDFWEGHLGRPKGVRCNCRGLEVRRHRRRWHRLGSTSSAGPRSIGSRRWAVQGLFREQLLDFPCAWDKEEMVACCSGSTFAGLLGGLEERSLASQPPTSLFVPLLCRRHLPCPHLRTLALGAHVLAVCPTSCPWPISLSATVGSHAWDPAFAAVNPASARSRDVRTGRSVKARAGRRHEGGCGPGASHCNHAGGRARNDGVNRTFRA